MSLSGFVILVWSAVLSALHDALVSMSTSSVTGFGIEVLLILWSSCFGSDTSTVFQVSANNSSTVVVIPEVVGSKWSPFAITGLSPDVTGV
jgi:predicted neutral ceramidase superfamily lipid hydrolase